MSRSSPPAPDDPDDRCGRSLRIRWGAQVEVRELGTRGSAEDVPACAGYIAKYATKSTEAVGGLLYRLDANDLTRLKVRSHVRRYVECAWRLGGCRHLHGLRLRRWAHQLGFRGHCFTKSRRYSTTFTALRQARHAHVLTRVHGAERRDPWGRPVSEGSSCESRRWHYAGSGYRTLGDAWLAESGRMRAVEERRLAREELAPAMGPEAMVDTKTVMASRMPAGERYVTAREVADRVGLSPDTILRYYRDGKIPGRRMPGQIRPVRFLWSEVEVAFGGLAEQAADEARQEWAGRLGGRAA